MAEIVVSSALNKLLALKSGEAINSRSLQRNLAGLVEILKGIRIILNDAERGRATYGEEAEEEIETWVNQSKEACFRLEDVIEGYEFLLLQRAVQPGVLGRVRSWTRVRCIESEIRDIKISLTRIKKRGERYAFRRSGEEGVSCTQRDPPAEDFRRPRASSLWIEEGEVVGFEAPKRQLIDWLLGEGEARRTAISIVGMGGLGKTTLAKKVYDSPEVINHFDCRAWITVSQTYTVESLLREMMVQLCEANREAFPEDLFRMDKMTLTKEVGGYMQRNRYLVFFDDVWRQEFWDEIEYALPDNKNGSRIVITTRKMGVAEYCKMYSLCHVYELKPLTSNDAWELFCKKAFRESDGLCPPNLEGVSREIVRKCEGLPLAVVTIGGLLSSQKKTISELRKVRDNLSLEMGSSSHLTSLTRVLSLSYNDLPYYLKSCFLYVGIYPEDYTISCARLIRQWIAEGFVKQVEGKTLEEAAEGYLTELVNRSLVQVSLSHLEGRPKSCRIHDIIREMIIRKMKDSSFARFVDYDDAFISNQLTRRLAIAGSHYTLPMNVRHPHIRSIHIFNEGNLPESFLNALTTKFRFLKLLDFENTLWNKVPDKLGNISQLRYLNLRNTNVRGLPKCIGKMLNLETLDLRETLVQEIPSDIKKLTKLRLLLVYHRNYSTKSSSNGESGVKIKEGIACLTSLQKLYYVQANYGGIDLIEQLSKLKGLRKLGLKHVRREYGHTLCASIEEMSHLQSLDITAVAGDEIIDLHSISSPPKLRRLCLRGRLEKLPDWVSKVECLVKLTLSFSKLNDDALKSLGNLPNLLDLSICNNAYVGEILHFREGYFQKLKNLFLERLDRLNSLLLEKGALPVLEQFEIWSLAKLKEVPRGIRYLDSLQVLDFADMPFEFNQSIDPAGGEAYWIINHVPVVYIRYKVEQRRGIFAFDTRTIKSSRPSLVKNA